MTRRITLATDGRARSSLAADYAVAVATQLDATLEVVYVVDDRLLGAVDDEAASLELASELDALGERAIDEVLEAATSVEATGQVRAGVPHQELISAATGADLLVLGRSLDATRGPLTVSTRVVGAADAPVLSVPESAPAPPAGGIETVMVPTDGSDYPERALAALSDWLAPGATVHGVYVIDADIYDLADAPRSIIGILREGGEGALSDLATVLDDERITLRRHIRRGRVSPTLLTTIDDLSPDVVALGTRGRSAGTGPLVGSTTRAVLERASVPVLAAP